MKIRYEEFGKGVDIAKKYGVSNQVISRIKTGATWKHI